MAPFRTRYLDHAEIKETLERWAREHPSLVRCRSIGTSPEGRELLVATIGPDPDRTRPAAWVDGNMHAVELCGSSVALAIAEDMIALHREREDGLPAGHPARDLPEHVRDGLRETLLYVMPRVSPDGAEAVLRDGRYVRSNPRDNRQHPPVARWRRGDVDGDGAARMMRRRDPTGEYVERAEAPGLMARGGARVMSSPPPPSRSQRPKRCSRWATPRSRCSRRSSVLPSTVVPAVRMALVDGGSSPRSTSSSR